MGTINLTCETCGRVHEVTRTSEIPDWVISMGCNWCPLCEDRAEDYWEEWYNGNEYDPGNQPPPPIPDNQLCLPFIFDEIGIPKPEPTNIQ